MSIEELKQAYERHMTRVREEQDKTYPEIDHMKYLDKYTDLGEFVEEAFCLDVLRKWPFLKGTGCDEFAKLREEGLLQCCVDNMRFATFVVNEFGEDAFRDLIKEAEKYEVWDGDDE